MPPQEDELPSFPPSTPHDLATTPADPAAQIPPSIHIDAVFDNYDFMFVDDGGGSLLDGIDFAAPIASAWSTDADMAGFDDAACCATGGTTEIQHLEEDADQQQVDSSKLSDDVEQQKVELPATEKKLVEPPAHEGGHPSGRDADMPEHKAAATQPGPLPVAVGQGDAAPAFACATTEHAEKEAQPSLGSFKRAVEQDLLAAQGRRGGGGHTCRRTDTRLLDSCSLQMILLVILLATVAFEAGLDPPPPGSRDCNTWWSILKIMGAKGRKPHQPRFIWHQHQPHWKEQSMNGMLTVAGPSLQPLGQQRYVVGKEKKQQRYVGLKKTLKLDDDGNGNRRRGREYTPLLPSDDGAACSNHVEEEAPRQRWMDSFMSVLKKHLLGEDQTWMGRWKLERERIIQAFLDKNECHDISTDASWSISIVAFTGPDSKGRKPQQGGWKEKSMTGMRAAADPQPPPPGQQQGYVGLKKTLELDDDGNGNKWHAHEYTPLLPSDDGTNNDLLVPAEVSLRVEFKEDEPEDVEESPGAAVSSTKRKEEEPLPEATAPFTKRPKIAPKKSPVWKHMTKVHVKVAATTNTDGSQRKKPCYKVMFAICHHCDKVFNADSNHGTHNLSNHLESCNDCKCMHSHSR